MSLSSYVANAMLAEWFGTTTYLSLHTTDPNAGGLATGELTASTYQRQSVTWTVPSNRTVANASDVTYSALPRATVAFLGVYDALVGGKLLAVLEADPPYLTNANGSSLYIATSTLVIELL